MLGHRGCGALGSRLSSWRRAFAVAAAPRTRPGWVDAQHFEEARASLLQHLCDADIDHVDSFCPGSQYRFQYGGYRVKELVAEPLQNLRFERGEDARRLWQMCFELDRKVVLRHLPTAAELAPVLSGETATALLDVRDIDGSTVAFMREEVPGASVLCEMSGEGGWSLCNFPATGSTDRHVHLRDHSSLAPIIGAKAHARPPLLFREWATQECGPYLQKTAGRASNVAVVRGPDEQHFLVTTRNVSAGEELLGAAGLASQFTRATQDLSWEAQPSLTEVAREVLREVHAPLLEHERRAMGVAGALQRDEVLQL